MFTSFVSRSSYNLFPDFGTGQSDIGMTVNLPFFDDRFLLAPDNIGCTGADSTISNLKIIASRFRAKDLLKNLAHFFISAYYISITIKNKLCPPG